MVEMKVWDAALDEVPTKHIETLWQRAMKNKRDDFPLRSSQLLKEWDGLKEELREQAQAHANEQHALLKAGHGSLGPIALDDFKARHNLPGDWRLGDPYPPESDLHGKPVPVRKNAESEYFGPRDSHWYRSTKTHLELYGPDNGKQPVSRHDYWESDHWSSSPLPEEAIRPVERQPATVAVVAATAGDEDQVAEDLEF